MITVTPLDKRNVVKPNYEHTNFIEETVWNTQKEKSATALKSTTSVLQVLVGTMYKFWIMWESKVQLYFAALTPSKILLFHFKGSSHFLVMRDIVLIWTVSYLSFTQVSCWRRDVTKTCIWARLLSVEASCASTVETLNCNKKINNVTTLL